MKTMWRLMFACLLALFGVSAQVSSEEDGMITKFTHLHRGPPVDNATMSKSFNMGWITQNLDNFDKKNTKTWQQRYYISDEWYREEGPVFLFLGGEWEITPSFPGFLAQLAKQHGAFMIYLEHRYYGQSHPTVNITTYNLQWLTVEQALEDTAVFTRYAKKNLQLRGPWFVFGGSYSAMLAAWARARYPKLFYAAYASSGPVRVKYDFYEYMEIVGKALARTSKQCPKVVTAAMKQLFALVKKRQADKITSLFQLCETINLDNSDDVNNLYDTITYAFSPIVQYAEGDDLKNLCDKITAKNGNPLDIVAKLTHDVFAPDCISSVYQDTVAYYRDDVSYKSDVTRQWYYQTCTQFGFFISLNSYDQPMTRINNLWFLQKLCPNIYEPSFTSHGTKEGIANINSMYGGLTPNSTRVLYTHGSLDPWSPLGIQSPPNKDSPVFVIDGESHCRDLGTPKKSDSVALKEARLQIAQVIDEWVENSDK